MGCHPDHAAREDHPLGVAPTRAVPYDLPLSAAGRMICLTCHFPHSDGSTRAGVRKSSRVDNLCMTCHPM